MFSVNYDTNMDLHIGPFIHFTSWNFLGNQRSINLRNLIWHDAWSNRSRRILVSDLECSLFNDMRRLQDEKLENEHKIMENAGIKSHSPHTTPIFHTRTKNSWSRRWGILNWWCWYPIQRCGGGPTRLALQRPS